MHKTINHIFPLLFSIALYAPFSAQATEVESSIGLVVSEFEYEEENIMKDEGRLYGTNAHLAIHNNWMLRFEGSYIEGEVDYSSNGTGSMDNIDDYIYEFRALVGKDTRVNGARITPYTGFGYRYLNDDSSNRLSTTNSIGYEREQTYFYLPVGVLVNTAINSNWAIEGQFELDYLIQGKNKSHIGYLARYSDDAEFTQDTGYGYRISASFIKRTNGFLKGFSITPYIKYWHIDQSDTDNVYDSIDNEWDTFIEPENKSTEYGLVFALHF